MWLRLTIRIILIIGLGVAFAVADNSIANINLAITPGAAQLSRYLPLVAAPRRVAVFANQASQIAQENIVQLLLNHGVHVVKIFSPEHGFSGINDSGAAVGNSQVDGVPLISLYGKKTQPAPQDLADVDVIVFDIQDVGVRYYTYISSLQRLMEAATLQHKPLIILDRPNPNGFYVDGPLLESANRSFVGMQTVPIVYGMTIGEYAKMLVGEEWLDLKPKSLAKNLELTVIPNANYTHQSRYTLPTKPSPNLPTQTAILWYPSLGWFEGTQLSVGRGTELPFQVLGHPTLTESFSFTPISRSGALNPPLKGQLCHGWQFSQAPQSTATTNNSTAQIDLAILLNAYQKFPDKAHFFNNFFTKLAGTTALQQQIEAGVSESAIRASWRPGIAKFMAIRNRYLIYSEN